MPPKRSSKRGGSTPGGSTSHTPIVTPPSSRPQRPPSPLSPIRMSRIEEKKELAGLNDRLVCYIERIRSQETEINKLQQEVSTVEEYKTSEIHTIRNAYDYEIKQLRAALDDSSKDKAKFEIDAGKYKKEAAELKSKLRDKERSYDAISKDNKNLTARNNVLSDDLDAAQTELSDLRPEVAKLRQKLDDAKRNLEDETLKRIDFQNQLQTAQENLKFENQLLEQQLNESKVRRQIEISEVDNRAQERYEEKLAQSLNELRASYEQQLGDNQREFNKNYEDKMQKLQNKLEQERINSSSGLQELREFETKVAGLTSRNVELEASNASLQRRMAELVQEMEDAARNFRADMTRKDAEIQAKEEQITDMLREYQALMEIKVSLSMELAAYRKLLEEEENRLGLSQPGTPMEGTPSTGRGIKRKRTTYVEEEVIDLVSEHSGKGNIVIQPLDKDGKFISIKNNAESALNIGGWSLVNTTGGQDVTYKFHRSTTLQPGDSASVWSADTHQDHDPPLNLVMKRGGWTIGEENTTVLTNKDGDEEATRTSRKEKSLSGSVRYGSSHLYRQSGEDDKNCAIM